MNWDLSNISTSAWTVAVALCLCRIEKIILMWWQVLELHRSFYFATWSVMTLCGIYFFAPLNFQPVRAEDLELKHELVIARLWSKRIRYTIRHHNCQVNAYFVLGTSKIPFEQIKLSCAADTPIARIQIDSRWFQSRHLTKIATGEGKVVPQLSFKTLLHGSMNAET